MVAPHRRTSTIADDHAWTAPPFTMTVREVCGACNNGWMSSLEAAAQPILTPLILRQPAELDAAAQKTLATWATKTAMVYQLTTKHEAIRPHQFRALRDHLRPPAGVQVWLGCRTADEPSPSIFGYRSSGVAPATEPAPRFRAFLVTIAIGHYVTQVYGHDLPFDSEWTRRGLVGNLLQQIWPVIDEHVTYPPVDQFKEFVPLAEDSEFERELTAVLAARGVDLRLRPDA